MSTDIERELKREETELARVRMLLSTTTNRQDKEIDRILRQCKLDHYSVLGVQPGISVADVSRLYRKKSLLIHPDKTSHLRAVEAFDLLKKASNALQDDKERKRLDQMWTDARKVLIKENGWSIDDERLTTAEFLESWRAKVRELLIEEEFIRRVELKKQQNEELKKRKERDAELEQRQEEKRLRDTWESKRDERVTNWRKFSDKNEKKRKKKSVLV
ncbi:J domain-containing protein spf31 [Ogataea parapolymorpha DL-1]|uniref:J domain-containing protein spf31 n=1 Tax=Ogataea parapolymorpha (strain ATCC 26012 / BCRC 20466 / JCM 22074 / NRRL Y-7560 / DL-1) TaxID=871575 RepID=W1QHC7_OGAPD|nr:J domain-containing protein spf31 [Ogataea parapolymorpha DL-1]ESX01462.1 J domain-containing protein spf31 [Ogataea parapolymorpha DL-1]